MRNLVCTTIYTLARTQTLKFVCRFIPCCLKMNRVTSEQWSGKCPYPWTFFSHELHGTDKHCCLHIPFRITPSSANTRTYSKPNPPFIHHDLGIHRVRPGPITLHANNENGEWIAEQRARNFRSSKTIYKIMPRLVVLRRSLAWKSERKLLRKISWVN